MQWADQGDAPQVPESLPRVSSVSGVQHVPGEDQKPSTHYVRREVMSIMKVLSITVSIMSILNIISIMKSFMSMLTPCVHYVQHVPGGDHGETMTCQ